MKRLAFPKSKQNNIVIQKLNDEVLIYDLGSHKAFCLNETSSLVWQLCDGNNTVDDIGQELGKKLKTSVPEDLVWLAIEQLKTDNLLENSDEVETKFTGLSRRDVIRKVGLASVIALPLISSLVAPAAAAAQSVTCTTTGNACQCAGSSAVSSCSSFSCARGCTCRIANPMTGCVDDGFGGVTCTGACAA